MHPLANAVLELKPAHVQKTAVLNMCGKIICVNRQGNKHPSWTFTVIKCICITLKWINCAAKMHSWTLTFCKLVWQQIWGEVLVLIPTSFIDKGIVNLTVKNYENQCTFAKVVMKIKVSLLFWEKIHNNIRT